ncbi:amidohydrolase family protein [Maridesulfovibrio sp.]|uniref:amidohydrolase family protein n=1 Tax=unclassified Maridesulfovibrio TaxID=2794999 RepID=UPI003AFFDE0A
MTKRIAVFIATVAVLLCTTFTANAQDYDLVINGGRVMDPETMFDDVANVGVKDGRIAIITKKKIKGKETINAKGMVVAPGFIDTHWHNDRPWANKLALRDGRTTALDLEIGTHGPYLDQWYKSRAGTNQINYGQAVAHEFARSEVLDGFKECQDTPSAVHSRTAGNGWSSRQPSLEEGNKILQFLDEGLVAGGLGVGSTLGYMRDGVSAREFFELQHLASLYGRQTGAHFRYTPGTEVTEANGIQELLANAAALGAPALACHFNNPGYNLVHELLVRMRERGMNVWGEIYPYAAGSTALNAVFLEPEMWVDQLGYKYEDTIQDVATGEFYTQKSREEMLKKEPARAVLVYKMPKSAIIDWLKLPGVTIITDGMPLIPDDGLTWDTPYDKFPNTHPRLSGSFAKALRLARENDIPLMQIIAMSSYNSAVPLGKMGLTSMQERGRMQQGMVADITIFDPKKVTDNSTYEKGTIPSTGIPYVIVNGAIVVKKSKVLKGVNNGQPIRFEPVKSRFKPITIKEWTQKYYASPVDFGGGVPGSQPTIEPSTAMPHID